MTSSMLSWLGIGGETQEEDPEQEDLPVYEGEKDEAGKKHGVGTFLEPNGNMYEGQWLNDKRNGFGTQNFITGEKYQGQWSNDYQEGIGTLTWSGELGDTFEGNWSDGSRMKGTYVFDHQTRKFVGIWKDDAPFEAGVLELSEGVYHGEVMAKPVSNGVTFRRFLIFRHGKGQMNLESGRFYGTWKNDKREGYGVLASEDSQYYGNWANGMKSGVGLLIYSDGSFYEGEFSGDKKSGKGKLHFPNGDVIDGNWKADNIDGAKYVKGNYQDVSKPLKALTSAHFSALIKQEERELYLSSQKWDGFLSDLLRIPPETSDRDLLRLVSSSSSTHINMVIDQFVDVFLWNYSTRFSADSPTATASKTVSLSTVITKEKDIKFILAKAVDDVNSFVEGVVRTIELNRQTSRNLNLTKKIRRKVQRKATMKIYFCLFPLYLAAYRKEDSLLAAKIAQLQHVTPELIGIDPKFCITKSAAKKPAGEEEIVKVRTRGLSSVKDEPRNRKSKYDKSPKKGESPKKGNSTGASEIAVVPPETPTKDTNVDIPSATIDGVGSVLASNVSTETPVPSDTPPGIPSDTTKDNHPIKDANPPSGPDGGNVPAGIPVPSDTPKDDPPTETNSNNQLSTDGTSNPESKSNERDEEEEEEEEEEDKGKDQEGDNEEAGEHNTNEKDPKKSKEENNKQEEEEEDDDDGKAPIAQFYDPLDGSPYFPVSKLIKQLSILKSPTGKLRALMKASKSILSCVDNFYNQSGGTEESPTVAKKDNHNIYMGAEDKFPVLIYSVIKSGAPNLWSQHYYLEDFVNTKVCSDPESIYRAQEFHSVLKYISALDPHVKDEKDILIPLHMLQQRIQWSLQSATEKIPIKQRAKVVRVLVVILQKLGSNFGYKPREKHKYFITTSAPPPSSPSSDLLLLTPEEMKFLSLYFSFFLTVFKKAGIVLHSDSTDNSELLSVTLSFIVEYPLHIYSKLAEYLNEYTDDTLLKHFNCDIWTS